MTASEAKNRAQTLPKRWIFPKNTFFGKIIAKEKVFKQISASNRIKRLFSEQIERLRCAHELTADALNLKKSKNVPKILIIQVFCRKESVSEQIFESLDAAFRVPVLFEVIFGQKMHYKACFRRRSHRDSHSWVFSSYFQSDWMPLDDKKCPKRSLPPVLSMDSLYEALLQDVMPLKQAEKEPFHSFVERCAKLQRLKQDADKLEKKVHREKQFNRRVELNRSLNELKSEIEELRQ